MTTTFFRTLQRTATLLPEGKRLEWLQRMEDKYRMLERATATREARQYFLRSIDEMAERGWVALVVWQRDCDMCESHTRYKVRATSWDVDRMLDRIYSNAEGPVHWHLQRMSDAFEPTFRDRALEAFEDGHPHAIY